MGAVQSVLLLLHERVRHGLSDHGRFDDQDQHISGWCLPTGYIWCLVYGPQLLVCDHPTCLQFELVPASNHASRLIVKGTRVVSRSMDSSMPMASKLARGRFERFASDSHPPLPFQ
jgi:hypothetical protein